jgi:hypothetical protein
VIADSACISSTCVAACSIARTKQASMFVLARRHVDSHHGIGCHIQFGMQEATRNDLEKTAVILDALVGETDMYGV